MAVATPNVPKTVLLTDPEPALLSVYTDLFRAHFFEVKMAKDGLECISRLQESPPDVLILHRELPWGGGDGVLTWMRETDSFLLVPVILVTTQTRPDLFPQLIVPPVVHCLPAPYTFTVILDAALNAVSARAPAWDKRQGFNSRALEQNS